MKKISILVFVVVALIIFSIISWVADNFSKPISMLKTVWNTVANFIETALGKIGLNVSGFGGWILLAIIVFLILGSRKQK